MPIASEVRNFCNKELGTDIDPTSDASAVSPGVVYAMQNVLGIGLPAGTAPAQDTFQPERAVAEVRHVAHRIASNAQDLQAVASTYSITPDIARQCLEDISQKFSREDVEKELKLFMAGVQLGHEFFGSSPQKVKLKDFTNAPYYNVPEIFYDETKLPKPVSPEYDSITYPIPPLLFNEIAKRLGNKDKTMKLVFDNGVEEVIHHIQYTDTAKRRALLTQTQNVYEPVHGPSWPTHAFLRQGQLSHHHQSRVTHAESAARIDESHAIQPFEQDAREERRKHQEEMDNRFGKVKTLMERGAEGI